MAKDTVNDAANKEVPRVARSLKKDDDSDDDHHKDDHKDDRKNKRSPVAAPPTPVAAPPTPVAAPPTPVAAPPTPVAAPPTSVAAPPSAGAAPPSAVAGPPSAVAAPPTSVTVPLTTVTAPLMTTMPPPANVPMGTPPMMVPGQVNAGSVSPSSWPPARVKMSDSALSDTTTTVKSKSGSMGSTVTVAVAVLFCLVIVGIAIFVVRRRKPKEEADEDLNSPSTTSAHFNGTTAVAAVDNAASNYNHVPSTKNNLAVVPPRQSSTTTTSSSALAEHPEILAVRLPVEKIESHELLSRGGYGEVHRGTYNGQQVAIKRLLPERRQDAHQIDGFLAEAKMMSTLKHEHIVQFIGVAWTSLSDLCVVSEFMEGGDLRAVLQRWRQDPNRGNGFDHDRIKIAVDVANAMSYLHSREPGILHRDLKSKNILLTPTLDAKLTDFGVSRERVDATMTAGVGTSLWMAPEVIMGGRYDEKADVFSFGAVLSELDTLRLPYANVKEPGTGRKLPDSVILQMVALGKIEVEFTANADAEMVALGRDCMAMDPKARPTAGEAYHRMYQLAQNRVSL